MPKSPFLLIKISSGPILSLVCIVFICTGTLHAEFGNTLRQDIKHVSLTDPDVKEVIKYVQQYSRKRYPWSIPSSSNQGPQPLIEQLKKAILIYSHDGVSPMYYNDIVLDRGGGEHGITKFMILGRLYDFTLTWTESAIKFCHNFTVSIYRKDHLYIYSHSFFLQNLNISNPVSKQPNYLFPKFSDSYFKYLSSDAKTQQMYTSDFTSVDLEEGSVDIGHSDLPAAGVQTDENTLGYKMLEQHNRRTHRQIKVMSYNIWNMNTVLKRHGDYTQRMLHLKNTVLNADPDIIALQEVRYEDVKGEDLGPCQIHTLSEWLPQYQYVYKPAQMQPNTVYDGRTEEGVAIMSKYPIISHNTIKLFINRSNSADTHQRLLLRADILIPSVGLIHVFNTHLSLSHEAREKSVVQIWKQAKIQKGPVIVAGDLNAEPSELAIRYLSGHHVFPKEEKSELIDVWIKSQHGQKGFTFGTLEKNLTKRIDYIFYRPDARCCNIESCTVLDDGTRGFKAASDHLPLLAVLSLKTNQYHSTD